MTFEKWLDDWYQGSKEAGGDVVMSEAEFKNWSRGIRNMYQQNPAEYLDKDMVYAIMNKLHELSFSQNILINSDEYKKIDEITSDVRKLLDYPIEQKPVSLKIERNKWYFCIKDFYAGGKKHCSKGDLVQAKGGMYMMGLDEENAAKYFFPINYESKQEWSDEDRHAIKNCEYAIKETFKDEQNPHRIGTLDWLKSLPERFNLEPKQEWSEEDEKIRGNLMSLLANMRGDRITEETYQKYYPWLKSLRPSWKPSEEQIKALEIIVRYGDKESTHIKNLTSLYEQLKAL